MPDHNHQRIPKKRTQVFPLYSAVVFKFIKSVCWSSWIPPFMDTPLLLSIEFYSSVRKFGCPSPFPIFSPRDDKILRRREKNAPNNSTPPITITTKSPTVQKRKLPHSFVSFLLWKLHNQNQHPYGEPHDNYVLFWSVLRENKQELGNKFSNRCGDRYTLIYPLCTHAIIVRQASLKKQCREAPPVPRYPVIFPF